MRVSRRLGGSTAPRAMGASIIERRSARSTWRTLISPARVGQEEEKSPRLRHQRIAAAKMIELHVMLLADAVDRRCDRKNDLQFRPTEDFARLEQFILNRTFLQDRHD